MTPCPAAAANNCRASHSLAKALTFGHPTL